MIDECCYEHVLLTLLLWFSPLMLSGSVFSSFAVNVVDPLALRCASHIQKDDHVNIPQSDLHVFSSLSLSSSLRNCAVLKLFFENSHSVAQRDYFLECSLCLDWPYPFSDFFFRRKWKKRRHNDLTIAFAFWSFSELCWHLETPTISVAHEHDQWCPLSLTELILLRFLSKAFPPSFVHPPFSSFVFLFSCILSFLLLVWYLVRWHHKHGARYLPSSLSFSSCLSVHATHFCQSPSSTERRIQWAF